MHAQPDMMHRRQESEDDHEIVPHHNDILLGRGGKNNQHVGNEQLRNIARSQRDNYRHSSKKGKSYISRQIVSYVRSMDPPGRFLKKCSITGKWEDMGDDIAREKAAQALRDAVSALHNEEAGGGTPSSATPSPSRPTTSGSGDASMASADASSPEEHIARIPEFEREAVMTQGDFWQEHRRSSSAPASSSAFRNRDRSGSGGGGAPGAKRSRSYELNPHANPYSSAHYRTPRAYGEGESRSSRRPYRDHPHNDIAAAAGTEYYEEFAPPRASPSSASSYSSQGRRAGPGMGTAGRIIQPSPVRVSPEGAQNTPPRIDSSPMEVFPGGAPLSPGKIQLTPICSNAKGTAQERNFQEQKHQQQEHKWQHQQDQQHQSYQAAHRHRDDRDQQQPYHPGEEVHERYHGAGESKYPAEYVPSQRQQGTPGGHYEPYNPQQQQQQQQQQQNHHQRRYYRPDYRPDYASSGSGRGGERRRSREYHHGGNNHHDPSLLGDFHANSSMNDEDFDLFDGDLLRDMAGGNGNGGGGGRGSSAPDDDDVKSASTF